MVNYRQNLMRFGFTEADLDGPSDALVDALVVPDEVGALEARLQEHGEAGADHVAVQLVPPPSPSVLLARVAEGLSGL
jgi:hypothetical protein